MSRVRGRTLIAGLPLLVIVLAALGVWQLLGAVGRAIDLAERSDLRLFGTSQLQLRIVDAETGIRGYAATRDPIFLAPYDEAVIEIPKIVKRLSVPRGNKEAIRESSAAIHAVEAQLRFLGRLRGRVRSSSAPQLKRMLQQGKAGMDEARRLIDRSEATERTLNIARRRESAATVRTLLVALGATFFIAALSAGFTIFFITTRILRRLAIVVLNTQHVAAERELEPNLSGNDEIAELDRAVHRMADSIRARNTELIRYGMLADSARDGIVFIDHATMQIVEANRSAVAAYGYTADEFKNLTLSNIHPVSERATVAQITDLRDDADALIESVARRKDGTSFPIEIAVRSGSIDGRRMILEIIRDITDRNRAAAALVQAKNVAEDAARMKANFLANMSHEIRTPMNAIMGLAYLTLKANLDSREHDYVQKIQQSAQHLLRIINDVLDFSKIEAGKMPIEIVDFELEQVLVNVRNLVSEDASAKGLELIFDIDATLAPNLKGDPLRLGQILINFCSNAVKFTERGQIVLKIAVQEHTSSDQLVRFAVTDTGIGLTGEQAARLFQPFEQADASMTRKFGGSGLGLVIAKSLTALMNGTIGVTSEPGQGSTFWFTARLTKSSIAPHRRILQRDMRDRRALVVDDNPYARSVQASMLSALSFVVEEAGSGEAAVAMIQSAARAGVPYELAFLDWKMPDMDGFETAKRIRALPGGHAPKLIMVTAYTLDTELAGMQAEQFSGILIKPVQPSLLFDVAVRALSGDAEASARRVAPTITPRLGLETIYGASVLLVEDAKLNQMVATGLMGEANLLVDIAENGEIAVRMIMAGNYDLVLMDMQMPVLDGIGATQAIRRIERFADLPIVAMTANAMSGDRQKCFAAGMNDHIAKPIDPEDFFRVLQRWIEPRVVPRAN